MLRVLLLLAVFAVVVGCDSASAYQKDAAASEAAAGGAQRSGALKGSRR